MGNLLVYRNSYTISKLRTPDDGVVYECSLIVQASLQVRADDTFRLDVTVPTPIVTISPSGPIQGAMLGNSQIISCTVRTVSGVKSNSVMISWIGPGGGSIKSDSRVNISLTTSGSNAYTSSLQFTYLIRKDEGTYTCNVMILETSKSQSIKIKSLTRVQVKFSQAIYSTMESSGRLQGSIISSHPLQNHYRIRVNYISGNATRGKDFAATINTVTFFSGATAANFSVPIIDDKIFEGTETFSMEITRANSAQQLKIKIGNPSTAIGQIVDEKLTVQFSQIIYFGSEKSGIISVTLLLGGGTSSNNITVTVTPSNQSPLSAEGNGVDYTSTPIIATFAAGATNTTINIPVTSDTITEESETFGLSFTIPSSLSHQVIPGNITAATGNITDETTTVSFSKSTYSIDEDSGPLYPVLVLSAITQTDITVRVLSISVSASGGGVDYVTGPYTITVPARANTESFPIFVTNDNIKESNETFRLIIDSSSVPNGIVVGTPSEAVVTIVDKTKTVELPCGSILRTVRPELFNHCICAYTSWSSWADFGSPKFDSRCNRSNYSHIQKRNRNVINELSNRNCVDEEEIMDVCEPTIEENAKLLVAALDMGQPTSTSIPNNATNIRRSIANICDPPSEQQICQGLRKKRSILLEKTVLQKDYKSLYNNISTPKPFNLEEQLSIIKKMHRHRRQTTNKERYLLFILDTSGSIGGDHFNETLDVLSEFIPYFCEEIKVAVMTFGNIMKQEICFNCRQDDRNNVMVAIRSIKYRHGLRTRTGTAVECACSHMLSNDSQDCGFYNYKEKIDPEQIDMDPEVNLDHPKTDVIFITDGYSNEGPNPCKVAACFQKIPNVNVFAIGIGSSIRLEELTCIVGEQGNVKSVFSFIKFSMLQQLKNQTVLEANNGVCFNRL